MPKETYTAEEVGELRVAWEANRKYDDLRSDVNKMQGQMDQLPAVFEAKARAVFSDMFLAAQHQAEEQRQTAMSNRFRVADLALVAGQIAIAAAVLFTHH